MSDLISIAPGVFIATSRRDQTNTIVLASISEALIIDPAWEPDELDDLATQITDRGLRVLAGISTHAHFDHLLWHPTFGPAPRYASRHTVTLAHTRRNDLLTEWAHSLSQPTSHAESTTELTQHKTAPENNTQSAQSSTTPAPSIRDDLATVFAQLTAPPHAPANPDSIWLPRGAVPQGFHPELIVHNAHIAGHTAVWLPEQKILIAGDMLSDIEPPLPDTAAHTTATELNRPEAHAHYPAEHTNSAATVNPAHSARNAHHPSSLAVSDYLAGLAALEPYAQEARIVIPGHGTIGTDAHARLTRDRATLTANHA